MVHISQAHAAANTFHRGGKWIKMTPLLGSPWINAWLNVHSTSILLAGKEDLFHIENNLYCKLY